MVLSRAEIQKRYRERKKVKEGEQFLAKERARQKKYFVPIASLSRRDKEKRRQSVRERVQKYRKKKKEEKAQNIDSEVDDDSDILETSGYESLQSENLERLVVKLPCARKNGPRKRISRALSKANYNLKNLKNENEMLRKKLKSTQRKMQRLQGRKMPGEPHTPKSKTKSQLDKCFSRKVSSNSKVRRQLLMSNVVSAEIAQKRGSKRRCLMRQMYGAVVGHLLHKYRCISQFSRSANVNRNLISKIIKDGISTTKQRKRVAHAHKKVVLSFLERDDNSRMQPGKKDAVKTVEGEVQCRVLTDYIANLHEKFLSENPHIDLSLSTFRRMRPKHILTTTFLSRNTCLCTKHQNFAFKLKMLKNYGIITTTNPDEFVKHQINTIQKESFPENVAFSLWKRVEMEDGKKR